MTQRKNQNIDKLARAKARYAGQPLVGQKPGPFALDDEGNVRSTKNVIRDMRRQKDVVRWVR